jgi:hypothetical protein
VAFGIMPVFALVNAGVSVGERAPHRRRRDLADRRGRRSRGRETDRCDVRIVDCSARRRRGAAGRRPMVGRVRGRLLAGIGFTMASSSQRWRFRPDR